mmetsp:Transcript_28070/g.68745  ORF Transcript_28070/g.68745 Transcript_28070/m.68745 type:complete len:243 (-) Transcript_28070:645-1373(-)
MHRLVDVTPRPGRVPPSWPTTRTKGALHRPKISLPGELCDRLLDVRREKLAVHALHAGGGHAHIAPSPVSLVVHSAVPVRRETPAVAPGGAGHAAIAAFPAVGLVAALQLFDVGYDVFAVDEAPHGHHVLLDARDEALAVGALAHVERLLDDVVAVGVAHHDEDRGLALRLAGELLEEHVARVGRGELKELLHHVGGKLVLRHGDEVAAHSHEDVGAVVLLAVLEHVLHHIVSVLVKHEVAR